MFSILLNTLLNILPSSTAMPAARTSEKDMEFTGRKVQCDVYLIVWNMDANDKFTMSRPSLFASWPFSICLRASEKFKTESSWVSWFERLNVDIVPKRLAVLSSAFCCIKSYTVGCPSICCNGLRWMKIVEKLSFLGSWFIHWLIGICVIQLMWVLILGFFGGFVAKFI